MSNDITRTASALQEAISQRKQAVEAHVNISMQLIEVNNEIKEALRAAGQWDLVQELESLSERLIFADTAATAAKKAEKEAHEAFSKEVLKEALWRKSNGIEPYGRDIHPNCEVVRSTEVIFPENPYEFGAAMIELIQKGKRELITIKTHGATEFFKNTPFALIKIQEVPATRIDSADKWPATNEAVL